MSIQGGKDAASSRYIYTELSPITRNIFSSSDDQLLKYLVEDNDQIEPEWYIPVVPVVLLNGAEGIGTGLSFHKLRFYVISMLQAGVLPFHAIIQRMLSRTSGK